MKHVLKLLSLLICVFYTDGGSVSVKEGDSVTLNTGIKPNQPEKIQWYFNGFQIAEITADLSYICTDVHCKYGDERFRERLKLDKHTGSLTIINMTITDSGLYYLQVTNKRGMVTTDIFIVGVYGFVMKEDSVTPNTDSKTNQAIAIKWYFSDYRIVVIAKIQSQMCTDDECKERFRDGLKVDSHIGSLTITNNTNTDSGLYQLEISDNIKKNTDFGVVAHSERDEIRRKSVEVAEPNVTNNKPNSLTWIFYNTRIAEMTGDQSQICADEECKERFRDRLKVDGHTGSLTITDTRTTDSGEYQLNIRCQRIRIIRNVGIFVTAVVIGLYAVVVGVLLLLAAATGLIVLHRSRRKHIRRR